MVASQSIDKELLLLNEAIESNPFEDSLYYLRAEYLYDQGAYDATIKDLKYALQLDSTRPEYYHLLADAQMDSGNSFDGLATMVRSASVFPNRIPTLLKLSEYLHILKQYDRSLALCSRIIQLDGVSSEGHLMAALNYRDLKDTLAALTFLKKATTYDDQLVDGWILLGQLTASRKLGEAKTYFENAIRLDSTNVTILHTYAAALHDLDNPKALNLYARIMLIQSRYTPAYLNAGLIYFSMDSFQLALEQFDILCSLESTTAKNYYFRGTVKEAVGDLAGAKADYEQAIQLDPGSSEARNALSALK